MHYFEEIFRIGVESPDEMPEESFFCVASISHDIGGLETDSVHYHNINVMKSIAHLSSAILPRFPIRSFSSVFDNSPNTLRLYWPENVSSFSG